MCDPAADPEIYAKTSPITYVKQAKTPTLIQHGENGLLATSSEEWMAALELLIDDAAMRERLGAMGRRTVEEKYSMQRCAEHFASVVRATVGEETRTESGVDRTVVGVQPTAHG